MKRMFRNVAAGLLIAASACTDAGPRNVIAPENVQPSRNHVSYVSVCCSKTVYRGTTTTMEAYVYDWNNQRIFNGGVFWSHSANGVASTTGSGDVVTINAVAVGTTTIYANVEGKIGSATLTVLAPPVVTTVQITPSPVSVQVGQAQQLTVKAYDQYGNLMSGKTAAWSIDNSGVASITSGGSLQGVSVGSTTVRATIDGVSASASVTVQPYFAVSISGPSAVTTAGEYTWTATPSGGNGSYTYRWWIEWNTSPGQLGEHGTDSTATLWVDEYTPTYFILYVEAASGSQTVTSQVGVCNFTASAGC